MTEGFHVFFESPHRIAKTLRTLADCDLTQHRRLVVTKELTKHFEQTFSGSVQSVADKVGQHVKSEGTVGEWVMGLEVVTCENDNQKSDESGVINTHKLWINETSQPWIEILVDSDIKISELSKKISQKFGVEREEVYRFLNEHREKKRKKS